MHTITPLSFNDARRAWKGNTVGMAWVWKKHFFLLWQTKSGMSYEGEEGSLLPFPLLLWLLFFTLSLSLYSSSAVLNAGQVQRAHRPSLLQTKQWNEWGRVLFLPISSQGQLPAKASPTSWPHSGCLPISVSHSAAPSHYPAPPQTEKSNITSVQIRSNFCFVCRCFLRKTQISHKQA